jgi:eukaryotic-like serine/threonine-protein kinase
MDEPEIGRIVAASLTAAAHLHVLTMQLRGESVTIEEAMRAVAETYNQVRTGQLMGDAETVTQMRGETTLAPGQYTGEHSGASMDSGLEQVPTITDFKLGKKPLEESGTVLSNPLPTRARLNIGDVIDGRYRIIGHLGSGGMGVVFLGEQLTTRRRVAIKLMHLTGDPNLEAALSFFRQEAAALARLNDPGIAQIYDSGATADRSLYIAMEFVEGESLRQRLAREGALPIGTAVRILRDSCSALAVAHRAGIIHRDMKPDNLMLVGDQNRGNRVKILDFGLAILDSRDALQNITGGGSVAGTPSYMSPEQVDGKQVTAATDVYSLGVIAYETLAGSNPLVGETVFQTMRNHIHMTPPPISSYVAGVPAALEEVIRRALEKDPGRRFASAEEFARAL